MLSAATDAAKSRARANRLWGRHIGALSSGASMSAVAAALVLGSGLLFAPSASAQSNVAVTVMVDAQDQAEFANDSGNEMVFTDDDVTVSLDTLSATITGLVDGIRANNAGVTSALSITSTGEVVGNTGFGIYVRNLRGTEITVSAASVSGGTTGIFANNLGSGTVTVISSGDVTGANGRGIDARSYGSGVSVSSAAVSGTDAGIAAVNLSTGATKVTSTGTVSATIGNGIFARNASDGASTLNISAAAVSGGSSGIFAENYGTGALIVTATGAVTGTNGSGIYVRNLFGTDLTISTAAVSGRNEGIFARNSGSGALSLTSTGDVEATNGAGIVVRNNAESTSLDISTAAVWGKTKGIDAIAYGRGQLSITSTGPIGTDAGNGIKAVNTAQGEGIDITVASVWGGDNGIDARNFGNGALTITGTSRSVGVNGSGIDAFNSSAGTDLIISAAGGLGGTSGISAFNKGSGKLSVTSTRHMFTGETLRGIDAYNTDAGTNLMVAIGSADGGDMGIFAYNKGTGTLSVSSTGTVQGRSRTGINARSDASGTGLTVAANGVFGGTDGIYAFNLGTGALSVTATSDVVGTTGYGIVARNNGAGSSNLDVTATGVFGGQNGISASNTGTGHLSIIATGTVEGAASRGIDAYNTNAGTDMAVSTGSAIGGDMGIVAYNKGTGTLSVSSTGTVQGRSRSGINARSDASGTGLTVSTAGVTGGNVGIYALNLGTGALSITASGDVAGTSGPGINARNNNAGGTNLTISANAVSGGGNGIRAINNGTGTLAVTASGAVTGGTGAGIYTRTNSGAAVSIHLLSTASLSSTSGAAIEDGAGNAIVTLDAGVVVTGSIVLNDGNDTLNIASGTSLVGVSRLMGGSGTFIDTLNLNAGWSGALSDWEVINLNTSGSAFSMEGIISGRASVNKLGTGDLTLTGANTFTGGLTVSSGRLIASIATLGSGAIVNNAILLLDQSTDVTFNTNISGSGQLEKAGAGAMTLTGANNLTGGWIISAGSLIGNATTLGSGTIVNNATLVIDQSTDGSFGSVISGSGRLTKTGAGALTLTGANSFTGGLTISSGNLIGNAASLGNGAILNNAKLTLDQSSDVNFGSDISGTGSLTKLGVGALTLTGANSFTGGALISAGSLIGNATTLGGGAIVNDAKLVFDQSANGSFGAAISGSGSLTKLGAGALSLTGVNSFTGDLAILAGSLIGNAESLGRGLIVNNSALVFDQSGDGSLGAAISGSGSLTKLGAGALTLTGANTFLGGLTVSSGSLIGSTASFSNGPIVNNAALVFDQSFEGSFAAGMSGTGTLTKLGAGALSLTGVNIFTGDLAILAGSLIGNAESLGRGLIVNNSALVFDQSGDGSLGAAISGSGSLTKLGAGALTLTGANTFLGGLTVSSGSLIGSTASFSDGPIVNNAALVFDQSVDGNFASGISGLGTLTKLGVGALSLTGTNALSGSTTVSQGRLNVRGLLAGSAVTVQSGASLGGNGTIGALTAQSGSTVSPGNSIGTLSVNGNVTLAMGSTLAMEVSTASADLVAASGNAVITGSLVVTAGAGTYTPQSFTLLSSSSLIGIFSAISLGDYGTSLRPTIIYSGTSVILRLDPNSLVELSGRTLRGNSLAVATAFDTSVTAGYNPQPFLSLYTQSDGLASSLGQFSGELHSAERRVVLQDTRVVRESAFDSLNADLVTATGTSSVTNEAAGKSMTVWMRGAGSWGTAQADGIGSAFKTELKGVLLGADFASNGFKIGGLFHQTNTEVDLGYLGQSNVESVGATLYAGYRQDGSGFAMGFGAGLASNTASAFRSINVPGLSQGLAINADSMTYQVFGEVSYDLAKADNARIEPFVRVAHIMLDSKAFAETGGIAALRAGKQNNVLTTTTFGLRGAKVVGKTTLSGSAGWQRTAGDRSAPTFAAISGVNIPYEVHSIALNRNAVALETQANLSLSQRLTIGFGYSALVGSNNADHSGRATIRYAF